MICDVIDPTQLFAHTFGLVLHSSDALISIKVFPVRADMDRQFWHQVLTIDNNPIPVDYNCYLAYPNIVLCLLSKCNVFIRICR